MKLQTACQKAGRLAKKTEYKRTVYIHQIGADNYEAGLDEYRAPGVLYYVLSPRTDGGDK